MLEFPPQISLSKFLISFIILKYLKKILSFQLSVLINSLISILRLNSFKTKKYIFFYHCLFFITHSQCSTNEITTFQQKHIALLSAFTIIYTFIQTRVAYLNGLPMTTVYPIRLGYIPANFCCEVKLLNRSFMNFKFYIYSQIPNGKLFHIL